MQTKQELSLDVLFFCPSLPLSTGGNGAIENPTIILKRKKPILATCPF